MLSPYYTYLYYFPKQAIGTIITLLLIAGISWFVFRTMYKKGRISHGRYASAVLLVVYILLVSYITFLGRRSIGYYRYNFEIGWSYVDAFINGNMTTLVEIGINIILFIPIGFLGVFVFRKNSFWKILLTGISLSALMEMMQFYMQRGLAEYDDLISNTIGVVLGSVIALLVKKITR